MESTQPKPFVFVLMPFDVSFDDVYRFGIKAACADAGAYCERVDEQIYQESMLERIYNQISKADVLVADMTGRNANVFYEVGYAHALGKRVILLTQNANDIPFDLKHYSHIVYGGRIGNLKDELERRIRWAIENLASRVSQLDALEIFVDRQRLESGSVLRTSWFRPVNSAYVKFSVHNGSDRPISGGDVRLALISPDVGEFLGGNIESVARLPDGRLMVKLRLGSILDPDDWADLHFDVRLRQAPKVRNAPSEIEVLFRISGTNGMREFPLQLRFDEESMPVYSGP